MKPILRKNQQGIAMIIAIMVLSLGGSIALIAFRSSTQELALSRLTEYEMSSQYLAESGVDQVLSWVMDPTSFPETYADHLAVRAFLGDLPTNPCDDDDDLRKLEIEDDSFLAASEGPFSELKEMGEITAIKFYAPLPADPPVANDPRLCTLEVTAISGKRATKKIRVDLASSSIGPITAGIQGVVATENVLPVWTHWGEIHYAALSDDEVTPDANLGDDVDRVPKQAGFYDSEPEPYDPDNYGSNDDPKIFIRVEKDLADEESFISRLNVQQEDVGAALDKVNPDEAHQVALRRFLKANGEIYTLSSEAGKIEKNGVVKTFDQFFCIPQDENPNTRLVWITDTLESSPEPLSINCGHYKGYFFFSKNISIAGGHSGRTVSAKNPNGDIVDLDDINLEGLFYTSGSMTIQDQGSFKAYGAFFARGGFTGAGTQALEVWYNSAFESAIFPGIRSVTPLRGTWATLPPDDD